jgi:hypothetical protein
MPIMTFIQQKNRTGACINIQGVRPFNWKTKQAMIKRMSITTMIPACFHGGHCKLGVNDAVFIDRLKVN